MEYLISMSKLTNQAGTIKANFPLYFTYYAFSMYEAINKYKFKSKIEVPDFWVDCMDIILKAHKSNSIIDKTKTHFKCNTLHPNNVVIAFSGGLDSAYQALYLREQGYEVTLLHVCNMNRYTNGQEKKVAIEFAKRFKFPIELVEFSASRGHKEWEENSFKTSLCYALCMDYCVNNCLYVISSGDDLRLNLKDAVVGTNLGDVNDITNALFKNLPFKFLPIQVQDKASRLDYLTGEGARDYYYSCVTAGRLNQYRHKTAEEKYGIILDKYSCGNFCRKCASHVLSDYYFNQIGYPKEFIDKCWDRVAIGADMVFYGKHLSLKERIKNLKEY